MTDPDKRHDIVEERLSSWLAGDEAGIRHALIRVLLTHNDLSIQEIYENLSESFSISYHSVSGMIGIVSSRIGIITGIRSDTQRCRLYRLRDKYKPIVRRIVSACRRSPSEGASSEKKHKHFFPHSMNCLEDV